MRVKGVFSPVVGMGSPILTRLTKWKIVPKLTADQAVVAAARMRRLGVLSITVRRVEPADG